MTNTLEILKKYWDYDSFRENQEAIINAVLENKDVIALLPTGGGKSLCFQLPAMMKKGICIVVTPLIALMKDQVAALQSKNIKATSIEGGISFEILNNILDNCTFGNYKFLYLSPERLMQPVIKNRIAAMPVNLIAIDEAHCISQWGHDFRPAYLKIIELRKLLPNIPTIALTATATKTVQKDIQKQLEIENAIVFKNSFKRKNIRFEVIQTEAKQQKLVHLANNCKGSGIIYLRNRLKTVEISRLLNQQKITADFFHGGISLKEKENKLKKWLNEDIKIIVATNAFGLGIDKPNVRMVVHLQPPENIESYYQEAGRAGRDNKPSTATIITHKTDYELQKSRLLAQLPNKKNVAIVYRKLCNYLQLAYGEGQGLSFSLDFIKFCETYQFNKTLTYNVLRILENNNIFQVKLQPQYKTRVKYLVHGNDLERYLYKNPTKEEITKALLRTYGGIFDLPQPVQIKTLSEKTKLSQDQCQKQLEDLKKDRIIDLEIATGDTEITFLVPREDDKAINKIAAYIKNYSIQKIKQFEAVIAYINNQNSCKQNFLLNYFGERSTENCGNCSYCIKNTPQAPIDDELLSLLKTAPKSSTEIENQLSINSETVLKTLQRLLAEKKVMINSSNQYQLR